MMTPRELLEKADHDTNTYKVPDVKEAQALLDTILVAMGRTSIKGRKLEEVCVDRGEVYFRTTWVVFGDPQFDADSFPDYIIDAEDPIAAAKKYGLREQLSHYVQEAKNARAKVITAEATIVHLGKQLREVDPFYVPYNMAEECSPTHTQCPRCNNPSNVCDIPACTCPSGDGSLQRPCPAHPPEGDGTPPARLQYLLGELAARFPKANKPFASDPPELRYLAEIDKLLKTK